MTVIKHSIHNCKNKINNNNNNYYYYVKIITLFFCSNEKTTANIYYICAKLYTKST